MTSTPIKTIEMPTPTWIEPRGGAKVGEEREIEQQMGAFYTTKVDAITGQYGMTLLRNGEIIGDIDGAWRSKDLEESKRMWQRITEAIAAIDFSDAEEFDTWLEDGEWEKVTAWVRPGGVCLTEGKWSLCHTSFSFMSPPSRLHTPQSNQEVLGHDTDGAIDSFEVGDDSVDILTLYEGAIWDDCRMNGAEMRADLWGLGLSLPAFSKLTGWDQRTLERQASGKTPVTERTEQKIWELQAMADAELSRFRAATEKDEQIKIPRLDQKQAPGDLPPHWWLAIASRHRKEFPDHDNNITWAD